MIPNIKVADTDFLKGYDPMRVVPGYVLIQRPGHLVQVRCPKKGTMFLLSESGRSYYLYEVIETEVYNMVITNLKPKMVLKAVPETEGEAA